MTIALPAPVPGADVSLPQMFFDRAKAASANAALRVKKGGGYVDVSYAAYAARVEAVAAGLLSLPGGGVAVGAGVGIFAGTRVEWLLSDFAAMSIGAITVPIYASLLGPEAGYIVVDADIEVLIVEGKQQLEKARAFRDGFRFLDVDYGKERVKLRKIIVMDTEGIAPADDWESFEALEERGRLHPDLKNEREKRTKEQKRSQVASICYTSGTTGAPKGVVHTHENWLSLLDVAGEMRIFTEGTRETGVFLFLPLAHAFGRLIGFGGAYFQSVVVLATIETLLDDLTKARPGFVPSAPRMYEKMYAKLMSMVAGAPPRRQKLFARALEIGRATIPYRQQNKPWPLSLKLQHAVADKLVLSKLRARLGLDRAESMLTGSAPIAPAVHEFFFAIGLTLVEAYGLTETTPGISANTPDCWKLGTVGKKLKCVQLKIAEDGEICVKGPNVTQGYHKRPDANADAFDKEGWFHTGDIGELDGEGFLRITDRKKDLLKTSGGKYVAPQKIEGLLKARPLISEAVVIGDNLKYCTALIVVDEEALVAWAQREGKAADKTAPSTLKFLQEQIDAVNKDLSSFESIKYFRVVPEAFTVDNGMLTASLKVKRKAVSQKHAALIEEMYKSGKETREAA